MKQRIQLFSLIGVAFATLWGSTVWAQQDQGTNDLEAVRSAIKSYQSAFNQKNAELVVSHWSPDGVYVNESTGESTAGHDAMLASLKELFAGENAPKLALQTESLDLVSPNVALERGTATVTFSEDNVEDSQYKVIYVKRDGKWLIDRVTEEAKIYEENHFDELEALDAMTGSWMFENDQFRVEMDLQWTTKRNFISRKFKVIDGGEVSSSGLQIIGWDAKEKKIKSWLFDSDGGFVEGTWYNNDGTWSVQCKATLAEGQVGSYTIIMKPSGDSQFSWKKVNRIVEGKLLPNIEEVTFYRQ